MEKCWCGNCNLKEYSDDYYVCDECGTLVSKEIFSDSIYQVSDEEKDLYGKNYWMNTMLHEAGVEDVADLLDLYLNGRAVYWLQFALKYFKLGGTIAEVGCGLGQFAYLMKKSGFYPIVYELSEEICQYVRETMKIPVICGEMMEQEEKFDTIVAMDVFEHLIHPQEFLNTVLKNLKEDGKLCLQLPCYDPGLSFQEMVKEKPNFQKLLVRDQHVYLYSKDSIKKILLDSGFQYIQFEPAFFGDDYDMFLFASRTIIRPNEQKAIDNLLDKIEDGLLIKAHLNLFDKKEQHEKELEEKEKIIQDLTFASEERLEDINRLSVQVKERNEEVRVLKGACEERLENINKLSVHVKERDEEVRTLKSACEERLENINKLSMQISEKDEEIRKLENACEERLQSIVKLTELNTEKDNQIEVFRIAAEERLEDIKKLNILLKDK